jgi:3-deoxy-manno-octulosonate cytidylyltransferase (CMP-KDO synthetase)
MRILAVIPARFSSTRFPGKPLATIGGKPMVQRVWEQVRKCNQITDIVVATDDERIVHCVQQFGGNAVMTSADHPTGTDRVAEIAAILPDYIIYVNVQGDEPFIAPESISAACEMMLHDSAVLIGTLIRRLTDPELLHNPNTVKVVRATNGDALYFSRSAIPHIRGNSPETWPACATYWQHIGLYAFRREALIAVTQLPQTALEHAESLEQLRWLEAGYRVRCAETEFPSLGVDVPEDIARLSHFWQ